MMGNRTEYESSAIKSASYDQAKRELEVEFRSGDVYRYADVPPEEAEGFASASSKGGYFQQFIRNSYSPVRVPVDIDEQFPLEPEFVHGAPPPQFNFENVRTDIRSLLVSLELTPEQGDALIEEVRKVVRRP